MSGSTNPKGNNNPSAWELIEGTSPAQSTTRTIDIESQIIDFDEIDEPDKDENYLDDIESTEEVQPENFDEVLELTEYHDGMLATNNNKDYIIAEYNDIDSIALSKKYNIIAKSFVTKVTKFILDFSNLDLTEEHKKYIKQVGQLQLSHLADLMELTDVNKQMLNNIIRRVNATQAEDYAIINSYNNLVNQHLKLTKELENKYRSIPTILKRMIADVRCDQELGEGLGNSDDDGIVTSEFGETQFNNSKQMLKQIVEKQKQKLDEKNKQTEE